MADLLQTLLGGPPLPGAPGGTMPNQGQARSGGIDGRDFLFNLLAQSGYSFTPQSPVGAVGRSLLGAQQQGQQRTRNALENRLLESRIGINRSRAELDPNAAGANVQSTFITEDGKLGYVRRNGEVVVTEQDVKNQFRIQELADGSSVAVNTSDPRNVVPVITPDAAAQATGRKITTEDQTKTAIELPQALAGLDSTITKVDSVMDTVRRTKEQVTPKTTGFLGARLGSIEGTDAFDLRANIKTIQANLGFDQLQRMREASKSGGALGQVSERELDLLISAVNSLDASQSDEQLRQNFDLVLKHYENYKLEIEKMKRLMRERAGETPAMDMRSLSDEELQRIIDGG